MTKIEAVVETRELADVRDALREMGVRTMRVTEATEVPVPVGQATGGHFAGEDGEVHAKARVSVVVPDDLTDRVILTLLAIVKGGGIDEEGRFVSSIEHVVRLESAGFFDNFL